MVKRPGYLERLSVTLEGALEHYLTGVARQVQPLRVLYAEHDQVTTDQIRQYFLTNAAGPRLRYPGCVTYKSQRRTCRIARNRVRKSEAPAAISGPDR